MLKMVLGVSEQIVSQRRSTTFSKVAKTSFRKPRFRISFQICSIGFISGVYGGIWKSTIFSGTSSVPDLCHTLPVYALTKKAVTGKGTSLAQWGRCTDGLLRLGWRPSVGTVFRSGSVWLGICFVRILQF